MDFVLQCQNECIFPRVWKFLSWWYNLQMLRDSLEMQISRLFTYLTAAKLARSISPMKIHKSKCLWPYPLWILLWEKKLKGVLFGSHCYQDIYESIVNLTVDQFSLAPSTFSRMFRLRTMYVTVCILTTFGACNFHIYVVSVYLQCYTMQCTL